MLRADIYRMFHQPLTYILVAISFVLPIIILIITTTVGDSDKAFTNIWQIIGILKGPEDSVSMNVNSMCNINLIYIEMAVFISLFTGEDFTSGYNKLIFTIRSKRVPYTISKITAGLIMGEMMILAYLLGALIGGASAGISFVMEGFTIKNLILCLFLKISLALALASVYEFIAVIVQKKIWLSIIISILLLMRFYMAVVMLTPIDASYVNVIACTILAVVFYAGFGSASGILLEKVNIA